jgi:GH24 family phage-related lysozyme (muramidase)
MLDTIFKLFNVNWQNIFEPNDNKININDKQVTPKNSAQKQSWSIEEVLSTATTVVEPQLSNRDFINKIAGEVSNFYNGWISPDGIKFLIEHEGIVTHWYSDNGQADGNQTIGIGHLQISGDKEKYSNELNLETVKTLLIEDLKSPIQSVKNLAAKRELGQNQKDALISFIFNIGSGNWAKSTVLKLLSNPGFYISNTNSVLENAFMKFIYSNGQILNGLKKRRQAEYNLLLQP